MKSKLKKLKDELSELKSELTGAENDLDNYLTDADNFTQEFDDFLDDNYSHYEILGLDFSPSEILKECDPTAYRTELSDWVDGSREYLIDSNDEAKELDEIVTELSEKIEELEQEIENLED